jgi:hypothetical protein
MQLSKGVNMYDLSELEITGKDVAVSVLIAVVFLVVAFGLGYLLGCERTKDIYSNGSGAEPIGKELEQVGTNISDAKAGIEAAAGHADKVSSGIESAKESAQYIHSTADTSAELIAECQSIIEGIRARGQAAASKD